MRTETQSIVYGTAADVGILKKMTLVYCKKRKGNSHFGEERLHGVNERTDKHSDHMNSGSPDSTEQNNMGGP